MTGSQARALVAALVLALLAPAVRPALADDKPPVLAPEDYPPVADEPEPASTPANAAPATTAPRPLSDAVTAPAPLPPPTTGVEVGTLGSAEGPPAGLLDAANGGLGNDIWAGTPRATAEDLLDRSPLLSADPALRALAKRIAMTKAAAPLGPAKRTFIAARIERLLESGSIDEAAEMAVQATVPNDEDFARVQADALLTANRADQACGDLTLTRQSSGEPFWMELRAYCAAKSGDQATADLTLSVLHAQGHPDHAFDTLLADVLNNKTVPPGPITRPTAMDIFLIRQAGLPVTGDIAAKMGTPANLLVVRDPRNPPGVRLAAADRIVRTGAASISELKTLTDAQDIPLSRLANAAADAQSLPFLAGQALLRRAALMEPRPEMKAELIAEALSLGERAGLLPLAAGLQGDIAKTVFPAPANPDARLFARALLLSGRPEAASRWLSDNDPMQVVVALAAPTASRLAFAQAAYSAYATGLVKNPPDPDPDRAYKALILSIVDVLGRPMPADAKGLAPSFEASHWPGKRPEAETMRAIEQASLEPDRKGEALLMILDAVHSIGLRELAPDVTAEFVRLLVTMGLPHPAYELAMDALYQYAPPTMAAL